MKSEGRLSILYRSKERKRALETLVLNGSPHKNGDSMELLNEMMRHLDGNVDIFSAYFDDINPCNDCRFCWEEDYCPIDDKMQLLYQRINCYDNVIIISPLYFSELSGSLLSLCSRFQFFWTSRSFKQKELITKCKKGVLIITGAGDGDTINAEKTAGILFHHLKTECIGKIFSLKTAELPAKQDVAALDRARELALELNQKNDKT